MELSWYTDESCIQERVNMQNCDIALAVEFPHYTKRFMEEDISELPQPTTVNGSILAFQYPEYLQLLSENRYLNAFYVSYLDWLCSHL